MTHGSLGTIQASLPLDEEAESFEVDVIAIDIPFLFGLDLMERLKASPNVSTLQLEVRKGSSGKIKSHPLTRKFGHLYLETNNALVSETLFTDMELKKMHLHFYHPSTEKLYNVLKRAKPEDVTPETYEIIKRIEKGCHICQSLGPRQNRFKVSLPEACVFNRKLALDLCWIFGKPVLHVVDIGTNFNSAAFITGESAESCWHAFLKCWVTLYTGYPEYMKTDQGSIFKSDYWKALCDQQGITMQTSGIEDHHALGSGEQQHYPLRKLCEKIRLESPSMDQGLILSLALQTMNATMGPKGLVPSLLVFGTTSRIPIVGGKLPNQKERLRAKEVARSEYDQWVCQERIRTALRSRVPEAAHHVFHPGDSVYVFREHPGKRTGDWKGPHRVSVVIGKKVFIEQQGTLKPFSIDQVKKNMSPSFSQDELHAIVHLSETFTLNKTTSQIPEVQAAILKEVKGIKKFGIIEEVDKRHIPSDANIIPSRFLTVWKDSIDGMEHRRCKARWIAGGHADQERNAIVHDLTTPKGSSLRLCFSIAASLGWSTWTYDVTQAYLQSEVPFGRQVYLKPPPYLKVGTHTLFKLKKAIYGLSDAGDDWGRTISKFLTEDLGMTNPTLEPSLFCYYATDNNELMGMALLHVDDILFVGTLQFEQVTKKMLTRFECRKPAYDNFTYVGIEIESHDSSFELHQTKYTEKITAELMLKDGTFSDFRSKRAQLAWLCQTRPDIACAVAKLAQVSQERFGQKHVTDINRVLKQLRNKPRRPLKFVKLEANSTEIVCFSDSAFGNNEDFSSQIGYVIVMRDAYNKANIVGYSSRKSKRVVKSIFGGEALALSHAFDIAFVFKQLCCDVLHAKIPLVILIDSKSVFDSVTRSSPTLEKRLAIDLALVQEAHKGFEIDQLGFLRTENNVADPMTKIMDSKALSKIFCENQFAFEIEQWTFRPETDPRNLKGHNSLPGQTLFIQGYTAF